MTNVFAVIGDPIAQSKSPVMHQAAYEALGYPATYVPFRVAADQLPQAIAGMRALGIAGMNVTIPHKVAVMDLLDEIDPLALQIGAVNVIVNKDGKLTGFNTDGTGYVRSLREETGFDPSGKSVLVLGAGGACRAVVCALAQAGAKIIRIQNRTLATAQALAEHLAVHFPVRAEAVTMDGEAWPSIVAQADLILNTTSVGMFPDTEAMPVDPALIRSGQIVSDLIYNPLLTRWLTEAGKNGAVPHGGLGMFVYQGAYAFEYWTGLEAPADVMRTAVLNTLKGPDK